MARDTAESAPQTGAGVWLRRYHGTVRAPKRLVCFPPAGGSASYFFGLSRLLAPGIEVLAVQYPGRQDRRTEPSLETVADMADGVCSHLPADGKPFALFGHSLGAIVAFEVARRLHGRPGHGMTTRLFASGGLALAYGSGEPDREITDSDILAHLRTMSGSDERLFNSPELQAMVLPALRADYRAVHSYEPPGPERLDCPITALIGDSDEWTSPEEATGWQERTSAGFDLRVLPGGHFYLNDCQEQLARIITTALGSGHPEPSAERATPHGQARSAGWSE